MVHIATVNMADQILEIKLSRYGNCPWGFRLHGGADFGTALTIQKVRPVLFNKQMLTIRDSKSFFKRIGRRWDDV